MAFKNFVIAFLLLNISWCLNAQLTDSDLKQLESAWGKVQKKPVDYAKNLAINLIDNVAVPAASEVLSLLKFILSDAAVNKIVDLIKGSKSILDTDVFSNSVKSVTDIITQNLVPKIKMLADIFNDREKFAINNAKMVVDIGLTTYHMILEKSKPVINDFMSSDWSAEERQVVDKIIDELKKIDKAFIKKIAAAI